MKTPPCKNASVAFMCPITFNRSEWSEELRAYFCRSCGPEDE